MGYVILVVILVAIIFLVRSMRRDHREHKRRQQQASFRPLYPPQEPPFDPHSPFMDEKHKYTWHEPELTPVPVAAPTPHNYGKIKVVEVDAQGERKLARRIQWESNRLVDRGYEIISVNVVKKSPLSWGAKKDQAVITARKVR